MRQFTKECFEGALLPCRGRARDDTRSVLNKLMPHKKMNSLDRFSLLGKVLWGLRRGRLQNEGGTQNVNQVIRPEKKLQHLGYDDYRSLLACVHNPNNSYVILWIQRHVKGPPQIYSFSGMTLEKHIKSKTHRTRSDWWMISIFWTGKPYYLCF